MKKVSIACLAAIACALLPGSGPLTAAENARFRHLVSVYFDEKGVGLNLPEGVACGTDGRFIVGDTGNSRLLRFAYREKAVTGGSEIRIPQMTAPARLQLNSKGEIYALDTMQRRIVRLTPEGQYKDAVSFDAVPAPATIVPKGFVIDSADSLYVLDVFSARVLVLNAGGQFLKALPLPGEVGFGSGLAIDATGRLFLLDSLGRRLFSAAKEATVFTPLGGNLAEFVATLPSDIAANKGLVFVLEGPGSQMAAFGTDGTFLSRHLAMGWKEGMLNYPSQLCINDKDEVFIADRDNSRVQIFQLIR